MPEGPSIVILKDEARGLVGRRVVAVEGNTRIDKERLVGERIVALRSWGKHFLIELPTFSLRVHFMMFGSYRIDARKEAEPRLGLRFRAGELNLYTCSVRFIDEPLDAVYDWSADVMSDTWDAAAARKKLRAMPETLVCDALLDQNVFAGVGNIIKNEVLFRVRVHPLSTVGALPAAKLRAIVDQARRYSFEFLEWKRRFVLRHHWQVHNKGTCPHCGRKLTRAWLGKTDRRSFFCEHCQVRYGAVRKPPGAQRSSKSARSTKSRRSKATRSDQ
jgi:endonuclease-8